MGCGGTPNRTNLTVMAASSLANAFDTLAETFEDSTHGHRTKIKLVLAGSSRLATQLEEGAPADVVATADTITMSRIQDTGRLEGDPVIFALNRLVVAVNPDVSDVKRLTDITANGVIVAVCAEQVPCGSLTTKTLDTLGLKIKPTTREPNVRAVLNKVLLGEVDAGFVYASDVSDLEGELRVIVPTVDDALSNAYPIAALEPSPAADAFIDFVLSSKGLQILAEAGFELPK